MHWRKNRIVLDLENTIRHSLKAFGIKLGGASRGSFDQAVRAAVACTRRSRSAEESPRMTRKTPATATPTKTSATRATSMSRIDIEGGIAWPGGFRDGAGRASLLPPCPPTLTARSAAHAASLAPSDA